MLGIRKIFISNICWTMSSKQPRSSFANVALQASWSLDPLGGLKISDIILEHRYANYPRTQSSTLYLYVCFRKERSLFLFSSSLVFKGFRIWFSSTLVNTSKHNWPAFSPNRYSTLLHVQVGGTDLVLLSRLCNPLDQSCLPIGIEAGSALLQALRN